MLPRGFAFHAQAGVSTSCDVGQKCLRRELEFGLDAWTFPALLLTNVFQLFHAEDGEKAFLLPHSRCAAAAAAA